MSASVSTSGEVKVNDKKTDARGAGAHGIVALLSRGAATMAIKPIHSAFATRLRTIMAERGLTAQETARRMCEYLPGGKTISTATLSNYRTGRTIPPAPTLDARSSA